MALNKQMSVLMSERAQEMSQRADEAWADVDAAKQRLVSLRKLIAGLKRQAEIKRYVLTCWFQLQLSRFISFLPGLKLENEKQWQRNYSSRQRS